MVDATNDTSSSASPSLSSSVASGGETFVLASWGLTGGDGVEVDFWLKYMRAIFWALMITLGNIVTVDTNEQLTFTIVVTVFGVVSFSLVIGGVTSVISSMYHYESTKARMLSSIKQYLDFRGVPLDMKKQITDYFTWLWTSGQSRHQKDILSDLSDPLHLQLHLFLKQRLMISSSLFQKLSPDTLVLVMQVSGLIGRSVGRSVGRSSRCCHRCHCRR
jgi:hypothetical protein